MIHKLYPVETLGRPLLRASYVQLNILQYAAGETNVAQSRCAKYLQRVYGPDGIAIAEWVFADRERRAALRTFARTAGVPADKREWVRGLKAELKRFSRANPVGALVSLSVHQAVHPWARPALRYLRGGYTALRGRSLPKAVAGTAIDGYDFIREFRARNPTVYMCPACDGSRQLDGPNGKRPFTSLDHFLPQESYPHLALHPRNLVPVCAACNSRKGRKDPLKKVGAWRDLSDISLPYDCTGWKETTYSDVKITGAKTAAFKGVVPDQPGGTFSESVGVHLDLYELLKRWNERSDHVGYRLFRRIRQYFAEAEMEYRGAQTLPDLQQRLDRLLAFSYEDVGSEPDAYAVTWWLATLIKTQLTQGDAVAVASPLVKEISAWLGSNQKVHKEFSERGEKVRQRLP